MNQQQKPNQGTESVSGLNSISSSSADQNRSQLGEAGAERQSSTSSPRPENQQRQPAQSSGQSQPQGRSSSQQSTGLQADAEGKDWQSQIKSTVEDTLETSKEALKSSKEALKSSWQNVSEKAKGLNVSPTTLAIGAAAIGAAVWLGRKQWASSSKAAEAKSKRS